MPLVATPCTLLDVPVDLLRQKTAWDVGAVIAEAMYGNNEPGIMLVDRRGDTATAAAFASIITDRCYDCVLIDTLIVDRRYRSYKTIRDIVRMLHAVATAQAKRDGVRRIRWGTDHPKAMTRLLKGLCEPRELPEVILEIGVE